MKLISLEIYDGIKFFEKNKTLNFVGTGRDLSTHIITHTNQNIKTMQNRKRNRLQGFDYSQDGIYFITICTKDKIHHCGKIVDGKMFLNEIGELTNHQILWLENQYSYFDLHNFVVMPNHIHLLFRIDSDKVKNLEIKIKSVSSLIGAFKMTVSKQIHLQGNTDFEWQRSFHDHIVRNNDGYIRIDDYITSNPENWDKDKFYE